jgi:hypothetical protein
MAKESHPPQCKCGCGLPTEKWFDSSGTFKSYLRYRRDHKPGVVIDGKRRCLVCKQFKPVTDFYHSHRSGGRIVSESYCKPCHINIGVRNRAKLYGSMRNYWLLKRYGVTEKEVDALIAKQRGLCALCRKRPATELDHCHSSGRNRGVLCKHCNMALGKLGDTEADFKRIAAYLRGRA